MTDQPEEPGTAATPAGSTEPTPPTPPAPDPAASVDAPPPPTFDERMQRFGQEAGDAAERWGRRAEAAGQRWSRDPALVRAGDAASRIWGLIVLAIGLWFFADVTLGLDMPNVAWRDLWPIGLITIGAVVLVRGMTRRA